jgi:hypothetical protein
MAPVASKASDTGQDNMTSSTKPTAIESGRRTDHGSAGIATMLRILVYSVAFMFITIPAGCAKDRVFAVQRGTPFPLTLDMPFETFMVEHPDVIDVHSRGDRSLIVEGIALGASNIVFLDAKSIVVANIRILVCDNVTTRIGYEDEPHCDRH